MPLSIFAISIGAALGAISRWALGLLLNALYPALPPGTLAANILGGFLMGLAICFLAQFPDLSPNWRLFVVTGFLGALTTFSTFTAEIGNLVAGKRYLAAAIGMALHVCGSLAAFFLGIGVFALAKSFFRGMQ